MGFVQITDTHVIAAPRDKWAVRLTGQKIARKIFASKNDAISYARNIAKTKNNDLFVHKRDGTVEQMDTFRNAVTATK
jgi:hypothetical protein